MRYRCRIGVLSGAFAAWLLGCVSTLELAQGPAATTSTGSATRVSWPAPGVLLVEQHPLGACPYAVVSGSDGRTRWQSAFGASGIQPWKSGWVLSSPAEGCPLPLAPGIVPPSFESSLFVYRTSEAGQATEPSGPRLHPLLADERGFDGEPTSCPLDGSIVFTSSRSGDPELYRYWPQSGNLLRLTERPGYDGQARFGPKCERLVWVGTTVAATDSKQSQELFVADGYGGQRRQLTFLGAWSSYPTFDPSGDLIVFGVHRDELGVRSDLRVIRADGSGLARVSSGAHRSAWSPAVSPDGGSLAFVSGNGARGDVYVVPWRPKPSGNDPASRIAADVVALREAGGSGGDVQGGGRDAVAAYVEQRFVALGLRSWAQRCTQAPCPPNGDARVGPYHQSIEEGGGVHPVASGVRFVGMAQRAADVAALPFSSEGVVRAPLVDAGYGISRPELGRDDFAGKDLRDRIALVRRFLPPELASADLAEVRRLSDLRAKAELAYRAGARAVVFFDEADSGSREASLPSSAMQSAIPLPLMAIAVRRETLLVARDRLAQGKLAIAEIDVRGLRRPPEGDNLVALLPRTGSAHKAPLLLGARLGHAVVVPPGEARVASAEDDGLSGLALLLEVARQLAQEPSRPRDIVLAVVNGESGGLLGSNALARRMETLPAVMLDFDHVGRMHDAELLISGLETSNQLRRVVQEACRTVRLHCLDNRAALDVSDFLPFVRRGVPALHVFTGSPPQLRQQLHPSAGAGTWLNTGGAARVVQLALELVGRLATEAAPRFDSDAPALPPGDFAVRGNMLGAVFDYALGLEPGAQIAQVLANSPAALAGLRAGDRVVALDGRPIADPTTFDFELGHFALKSGRQLGVLVQRHGQEAPLPLTLTLP